MSDLVRYPVGNTIDRDHINWPTLLRSEIATVIGALTTDEKDRKWPVDVTLAQVMALCWRVKKWKFNGAVSVAMDYSFSGTSFSTVATSSIADCDLYPLNGNTFAAPTREQDLVGVQFSNAYPKYQALVNGGIGAPDGSAPISAWTVNSTGDIVVNESGSTPASGVGALAPAIFGDFVLYDDGTKLFAPPFSGVGALVPNSPTPSPSPFFSLSIGFNRNPSTVSSGTGPLLLKAPATLTIIPHITDSFDVPMELQWRLVGEDPGSVVSGGIGTGTFILEATEFWPYENSLHLPVWNSADGSSVNDPFS